ncbi:MAG TPA: chemotaxis-specific protein-glutamate methyltransferase CheB [Polyangium sp.]|nr:chemotaxis-specific protein-glutamate methyltransferase CheB [Polyangium sp.]
MKVLIVEDSQTVRTYVEGILRRAPDMEVLPPARDGVAAVELAQKYRPDVILMDLELPRMSGLEAICEIMSTVPRPIIVLSGALDKEGTNRTFESFQAGAVDVLAKPRGLSKDEQERFAERLLQTVRLMAEARVIRRPSTGLRKSSPPQAGSAPPFESKDPTNFQSLKIVLIGASTGGPQVIRTILDGIPAPFPIPIVICQHIVAGFEDGLAYWLRQSKHNVHVANHGENAVAGNVYLARADKQIVVNDLELLLRPPVSRYQIMPSADVLFDSAAHTIGRDCVALLLTGMGEDGRRGLLALKNQGALTITQSAATCVIDGMPKAARNSGASVLDLSPKRMTELLRQIATAKQPT